MLHDLQQNILKAIYHSTNDANAVVHLSAGDSAASRQQLSIYRGSVYGGLKDALAGTYPVVKALVGEHFFNAMLAEYISAYPCKENNLDFYGFELPIFINNFTPAKSVSYLADVATLEWAINIASITKTQNNNIADLVTLSEDAQQQLIFSLADGSSVMASEFSIDDIWNAHQQESISEINVSNGKFYYLIYKKEIDVCIERLTDAQHYFVHGMQYMKCFSSICDNTLKEYPETDIYKLFSDAIQKGWIRSFSLN